MERVINKMLLNNPLFARAKAMIDGKDEQQIEQIAKNLCNQIGLDFDVAQKQFNKMFGINK